MELNFRYCKMKMNQTEVSVCGNCDAYPLKSEEYYFHYSLGKYITIFSLVYHRAQLEFHKSFIIRLLKETMVFSLSCQFLHTLPHIRTKPSLCVRTPQCAACTHIEGQMAKAEMIFLITAAYSLPVLCPSFTSTLPILLLILID